MEPNKRVRKPNFSSAECTLILKLAEENFEIIRENFSSTLTTKENKQFGKAFAPKLMHLVLPKGVRQM